MGVGGLEKWKQLCFKCIDTTMACLGFKLSNIWKQKKAMKSGADFEEYVDWTWSYNLIRDVNNEDKFDLIQKEEDEEENNYNAVYDTFSTMRSDNSESSINSKEDDKEEADSKFCNIYSWLSSQEESVKSCNCCSSDSHYACVDINKINNTNNYVYIDLNKEFNDSWQVTKLPSKSLVQNVFP